MVESTNVPTISIDGENKLRPLSCDVNPLTRGDGAALFASGSTCVIATMLGPIEVKQQNFKVDRAHVECTFRPKVGLPQVKEKLLESIIREACETAILTWMNPRTMFSVMLQELDDCGGLEACAVNAACLALLCGGVPLKFTFAAVHCVVDKYEKFVLDPEMSESTDRRASFTFIFDSLAQNLVGLHTHGHFSMAELNAAEKLCREASSGIFQFYRENMAKYHAKVLAKQTATVPMET